MTTHDFDRYCDIVPHEEPTYHEQLLLMEAMESERDDALRQQGAIAVLQILSTTLSELVLSDHVTGDYFFGMHDALRIVRNNLDIMKGGVA